jgi:hypothetical protein
MAEVDNRVRTEDNGRRGQEAPARGAFSPPFSVPRDCFRAVPPSRMPVCAVQTGRNRLQLRGSEHPDVVLGEEPITVVAVWHYTLPCCVVSLTVCPSKCDPLIVPD